MRNLVGCLLLAAMGLARAEIPGDEWKFLVAGDYHEGEAPVDPGRNWLALAVIESRWHLVPARVDVRRIHDAVMDAEGERTGVRISSNQPKTVALLRGHGLRAGKVDSPDMRFLGSPWGVARQRTVEVQFKGEQYKVLVSGAEVHLQKGMQQTRLPELTIGEGQGTEELESHSLRWAGDLDGDGKLDLIVDYSGYNRGGACLYLSSLASQGELVGHAACHGGFGC